MGTKCFTDEEKKSLLQVPYTLKVSDKTITFTNAFKKRFWEMYQDGYTPREIMKSSGYDLDLFSDSRLTSIHASVKRWVEAGCPEQEGKRHRLSVVNEHPNTQTVIDMQKELIYHRQLLEFLKKIALLEKSNRRRNS